MGGISLMLHEPLVPNIRGVDARALGPHEVGAYGWAPVAEFLLPQHYLFCVVTLVTFIHTDTDAKRRTSLMMKVLLTGVCNIFSLWAWQAPICLHCFYCINRRIERNLMYWIIWYWAVPWNGRSNAFVYDKRISTVFVIKTDRFYDKVKSGVEGLMSLTGLGDCSGDLSKCFVNFNQDFTWVFSLHHMVAYAEAVMDLSESFSSL